MLPAPDYGNSVSRHLPLTGGGGDDIAPRMGVCHQPFAAVPGADTVPYSRGGQHCRRSDVSWSVHSVFDLRFAMVGGAVYVLGQSGRAL